MKIIYVFVLITLFIVQPLKAQQLDSILPMFRTMGNLPDSDYFLLTASDYNLWRGQPVKYISSMQIIDANNPWPPLWYATSPVDSNLRNNNISTLPIINAFEQSGKLVFTNAIYKRYPGGHEGQLEAVLMCDQSLEISDTFYKPGLELDVHDFAINDKGERLYFLVCDTTLNMKGFFSNAADSLVSITYEKIQIDNKAGKTIFSWDPVKKLGINAMYKPYIYEKSVINRRVTLGWSHGNSVCWDKDGNILYSYKYIGIGKISRTDGNIMWHVDRNHLKAGPQSDSLPLFLQHDLHFVKDKQPKSTYTVLSNGDSLNPHCSAYQFTVMENSADPHLRIVKRFTSASVPETGGGNYDVEANGDYLLNYGLYQGDSLHNHILFDYRSKDDSLLAQYAVLPKAFCYRVHKVSGLLVDRPVIVLENDTLVRSETQDLGIVWYELSGKDLQIVTKVYTGGKFKPSHPGSYCEVEKAGIGYAVSYVTNYRK